MAGDWIKMRTSLWTDPRVVRIASALCPLGVRTVSAMRPAIVGALYRVWSIADAHSTDGTLPGYTESAIDEEVGIAGLAREMIAVGWLIVDAQALVVPRFMEHNGHSAKRRAMDAERKRTTRSATGAASAVRPHDKRTDCGPEKRREELPPPTSSVGRTRGAKLVGGVVGGGGDRSPDQDKAFEHLRRIGVGVKTADQLARQHPLASVAEVVSAVTREADGGRVKSKAALAIHRLGEGGGNHVAH